MTALISFTKTIAKAIASGVAALVGTVVLALDLQPVDHQGVQYLTQAQWGIIILAVLASFGITWRVPNSTGLPGEESANATNPNTADSSLADKAPVSTFPKDKVAALATAQAAGLPVTPAVPAQDTNVAYLGGDH